MNRSNGAAGFSLIELLIVLILLSIMASVAMPSFTNLIQSNRVQSASDELYGLMQYAKNEAVMRNRVVTLENISGSDGRWDQQIRIYVSGDQGTNRAFNASVDEELREHTGFNQSNLTASGSAGVQKWLSFRPNGTLDVTGNPVIVLCQDGNTGNARSIALQPSGRITQPATTPTDCTP
jgi:prepilin-type N-terminal cleavage/methylation domain-containing protein